jgi:hypothetical protein
MCCQFALITALLFVKSQQCSRMRDCLVAVAGQDLFFQTIWLIFFFQKLCSYLTLYHTKRNMSDQEIVTPSSGLYTCLACQVAFQSAEGQRTHYRSDWHRYNLKRKVVNLPSVTFEQFNLKTEGKNRSLDRSRSKTRY